MSKPDIMQHDDMKSDEIHYPRVVEEFLIWFKLFE